MNIYLDIDGTLIHDDLVNFGQPAAGLTQFITALKPHTVFWLTTHCRDGNPYRAREIVKRHLSEDLHEDIDRITPTVWDMMKTEGIDWTQDFIWFDDTITSSEWERIKQGRETQQAVEINLCANPTQLQEITEEILVSL
jgi:hypothetical protein